MVRPVRIEQPTANKVTTFIVGGLAAFVTLFLLTKIDADGFAMLLIVFLSATGLYAYRAVTITATADPAGLEVRNLTKTRRYTWPQIDVLEVGPVPKGPGTGITVVLRNGGRVPIEASWGPWYQGKQSAHNTLRGERFIADVGAMRTKAAEPEPEPEPEPDPILIRPAAPDDAAVVAQIIDEAWHETYREILPHQALDGRDVLEDAAMVKELLSADLEPAGCLVAVHEGHVVGASVFGPPPEGTPDQLAEVYMLYTLASAPTEVGRRLCVRTAWALRDAGAGGVVGTVHFSLRTMRRKLERAGAERVGEVTEQVWYGIPIKVVTYHLQLAGAPVTSTQES